MRPRACGLQLSGWRRVLRSEAHDMPIVAKDLRVLTVAFLSLTVVLSAQTPEPPPIPYVASVKVNVSGDQASFTRRLPGGTLLASNMKVHDMIAFAHGLQSFEVEGGPDWIRDVRFDVTIKAETNVGPAAIGPT